MYLAPTTCQALLWALNIPCSAFCNSKGKIQHTRHRLSEPPGNGGEGCFSLSTCLYLWNLDYVNAFAYSNFLKLNLNYEIETLKMKESGHQRAKY